MISIFDLFKIGIGPSSSHTVGPMKAANLFVSALSQQQLLTQVERVQAELFGSLGATGKGHGSDIAVMLGLMGEQPQTTDVSAISQKIADIQAQNTLSLNQQHEINFIADKDLILNGRVSLPHHPNALTITAFTGNEIVYQNTYYSIGGGFVQTEQEAQAKEPVIESVKKPVPYPFNNAKELLQICQHHQLSIAQVVRANELANLGEDELLGGLNDIWQVMQDCVNDGCRHDGILPGGLQGFKIIQFPLANLHTTLIDCH